MGIEELIKKQYLQRIKPDRELAEKELKESDYDMFQVEDELTNGGYKWAIIKSYYAMFHAARAVLFLIGLKERSHFAVGEVLEALSKEGKLESNFVHEFKAAIAAREGADYHYIHPKNVSEDIVEIAKGFTKRMKELIRSL